MVLALAFDQRSILDILRDVTFACNAQELVEHLSGSCPCGRLFRASLLGDMEDVKRNKKKKTVGSTPGSLFRLSPWTRCWIYQHGERQQEDMSRF